MGTSDETPKKSSAQKGQGMLEYALMMSFVAMVYLIVFADGGFGGAITGTFDNANETLVMASEKSSSGDFGDGSASGFVNSVLGSSSSSGSGNSSSSGSSGSGSSNSGGSSLVHTLDDIAAENYYNAKTNYDTIDWMVLKHDIKLTFDTIIRGEDPQKTIASEYNLFYQLSAMTDNKVEYIYRDKTTGDISISPSDNSELVGWNDLMNQIKAQTAGKTTSSYKKGNETLSVKRDNTTNGLVMTYTNNDTKTKKTFSLYSDNNNTERKNIMTFKSDVTTSEGTTTTYGSDALSVYGSLARDAGIYGGNWEFNKNN